MRYTIFQHADHDWREACPSECFMSLRTVEADTSKEAMAKWFQPIADTDAAIANDPSDWQAVAEGVFILNDGEADSDWFALVVTEAS